MSHCHTDIDCTQFKSVLIVGRDRNDFRASNGVGKTTIFKAIEYVLFGVTSMKTLDKIIRDGADKCKVIFEFESNGLIFKIIRSRFRKTGKTDLRLFKKDSSSDWVDITQKTNTETEAELHKLIKINYVTFKNSIVFGQHDFMGLATATPKERKSMLKEPLQLGIYTRYEKLAKEQVAIVKTEIDKIKNTIEDIGDPAKDLEELTVLRQNAENLLKIKSEYHKNNQDNLLKDKNQLFELKKMEPGTLQTKLVEILSNKKLTEEKLSIANFALIETDNKFNTILKEKKNTEIILKSLRDQIAKLVSTPSRSPEVIQKEYELIMSKEAEGRAYIEQLNKEIIKLAKALPNEEVCSVCLQPVTAEHREKCEAERVKNFEITTKNLNKAKETLNKVQTKKELLKTELQTANSYLSNKVSIENKISNQDNNTKQLEKNISAYQELKNSKDRDVKKLKDDLLEIEKRKVEAEKELEAAHSGEIQSKITQLEVAIKLTEDILNTISKEISQISTQIGMFLEKSNNRTKDLEKLVLLKENLKNQEADLVAKTLVQQAFSPSGIPTMIINTILDELQLVANELISKLRPGLSIVFSIVKTKADGQQEDTLEINYTHYGVEREWEQLSGGQKVLIALSLKLGLSLIIQHRLGIDINFLVLDEVDAMLDPIAKDVFADVIRSWQDQFTIFVITHNDYLKDKFKHAILVEANGPEGSNARLVTSW